MSRNLGLLDGGNVKQSDFLIGHSMMKMNDRHYWVCSIAGLGGERREKGL